MSANYRNPNFLLPNEVNMATNPDLSVDRHSLYSMEFNGSSSYIEITTGSTIDDVFTNPFTISLWVKIPSSASGQDYLISKGAINNVAFGLYHSGGVLIWVGGSSAFSYTNGSYRDDTWHHIACVAESTTSAKIYVDGLDDTNNPSKNRIDTSSITEPIILGSIYSKDNFFYLGKMDEVALFNTALTQGQVQALSDSKNSPVNIMAFNPKPIAYYPLGEQARVGGNSNPNAGSSEWQFPNQVVQSTVIEFTRSNSDRITGSLENLGAEMTVSLWAKCPSTTSGLSNNSFFSKGFSIFLLRNNSLFMYRGSSTQYSYTNAAASTSFRDGNWHHIMIYRNGDTAQFYLDGAPVTTTNIGTGSTDFNFQSLSKDATGWSGSNHWDGEMSNLVIWKSNQTSELSNIYNNGVPAESYNNAPFIWYKLNAANSSYAPFNANFNSALSFDGTDEIAVPQFTLTGALSLSAWIKPDTLTGGQAMLFGDNDSNGYKIEFNGTTTIAIKNAGGNTSFTGAAWNTNKWQHLLITRDASDNVTIYRNGASWSTGTKSGDILFDRISGFNNSASHFDGEISNISVFNTFLNSSAVSALYNNGTPETSISSSPISWWKLDTGGTTITDYGSGGNNGTNNGATLVSSPVAVEQWVFTDSAGSNNGTSTTLPTSALVRSDLQFESPYSNFSLDFDGTGNYIDCGTISSIPSATELSVSFWANTNSTSQNQVVFGDNSSTPIFSFEYWGSNNRMYFEYGSNLYAYLTLTSVVTAGSWHNVVLVYNASGASDTDKIKIYVDGVDKSSSMSYNGTIPSSLSASIGDFWIGNGQNYNQPFNGKLDEVAIFNKELTPAEVYQIYNNGLASDLTSLSPISWWRLGEDAYFVNNNITIPNQITGGPSGTGSGTQTSMLVADAPGSYGSGSGVNLDIVDRIGEAPGTSPVNVGNSQSYNMIPDDRHTYVPGYTPAKVDNAFSMAFDGVNDYFDAGSASYLNGLSEFSLSCWFKLNTAANDKVIVSDWFYNSGVLGHFALQTENASGSTYGLTLFIKNTSDGGSNRVRTDAGIFNENTWYNVIFTFNSGTVNCYKNGNSVSLTTIGTIPTALTSQNGNLNIGKFGGSLTRYWNGNIDEVAIFDYALTPKQIKEDIYNASTTGKTADLNNNSNLTAPVAWYRMGD